MCNCDYHVQESNNLIIPEYCIRPIGGRIRFNMYKFDVREVDWQESNFPYDGPLALAEIDLFSIMQHALFFSSCGNGGKWQVSTILHVWYLCMSQLYIVSGFRNIQCCYIDFLIQSVNSTKINLLAFLTILVSAKTGSGIEWRFLEFSCVFETQNTKTSLS